MIAPVKHQGRAYSQATVCNVPTCRRRPKVRGLCRKHYKRWGRGTEMLCDSQPVPNLALVRQRLGLSKRALARAVGVHHNAISRIERGGMAHHETVRKLLEAVSRMQRVGAL